MNPVSLLRTCLHATKQPRTRQFHLLCTTASTNLSTPSRRRWYIWRNSTICWQWCQKKPSHQSRKPTHSSAYCWPYRGNETFGFCPCIPWTTLHSELRHQAAEQPPFCTSVPGFQKCISGSNNITVLRFTMSHVGKAHYKTLNTKYARDKVDRSRGWWQITQKTWNLCYAFRQIAAIRCWAQYLPHMAMSKLSRNWTESKYNSRKAQQIQPTPNSKQHQ